jgi:two-component system, NtrC family, response regulator AtoC
VSERELQGPTDLDALGDEGVAMQAGSRVYVVAQLGDTSRVIELGDAGELTVGRAPESSISADDSRVSRNHARIVRRGAEMWIEDLGSRNGTQVGAATLRGGRRSLHGGEVVHIGPLVVAIATSWVRTAARAEQNDAGDAPPGVVVADPAMVQAYGVARRLAQTSTTVLLLGETGAGKEVIAECIHRSSPRGRGPFVRINCASLPENLLESELFGHERGAFTGADRRKQGYLEAAEGGTLLLDEIGELPAPMQAKLLRVLESRRVARVGSTREVAVDVRFLCATHRDLPAAVAAGAFREDLYYRVSAFTLKVPPLRERPTEIALLAEVFAREFAAVIHAPAPTLHPEVIGALRRHRWPGNVRELRNALEHAVVMSDGAPITTAHLPESVAAAAGARASGVKDELADVERRRIEEALEREGGNQTRAAVALGISRRNLVYKLAKYGIRR